MKKWISFILLINNGLIFGQALDTLTLDYLHQKAAEHFPLVKQPALIEKAQQEKLKLLDNNYLPLLNLNSQVSYQSDVPHIPISSPFMDIPILDKDMYKINLDVNQLIYDGGQLRQQKKLENASLLAEVQEITVQLYQLKEKINTLYFSVLLIQQQQKILEKVLQDLQTRLDKVGSGVKNGVVLESQASQLQAEIIRTEQQNDELEIERLNCLDLLAIWTGVSINGSVVLQMPESGYSLTTDVSKRPEYLLFNLQKQRLDQGKILNGVKNLPRISAFGQLGYGRPGLNMLNNEFDSYYMIGARLNWNFWNWHQKDHENQILDVQKDMIGLQQEVFDRNLQLGLSKCLAAIRKYESLLSQDDEIIGLREQITRTAASQLDNGVITSSDYVVELNAEAQSRLNQEAHKIQRIKAILDYNTLKGSP